MEIKGDEDKITVNGRMNIINCSSYDRNFYIKIKVPAIFKESVKGEYITFEDEFKVKGKEEKNINISKILEVDKENKSTVYGANAFEYILLNEKGEVIFKGTSGDYQTDNWIYNDLSKR